MGRYSKQALKPHSSCAIATHEDKTVAQLKAEIERLKTQSASALDFPVSDIVPLQLPGNMKQPRLYFDPRKMERLKDSIHKHGVLEPILVRPGAGGKFEIISGARRWQCCCELSKPFIPGILREMSDAAALEAALIAHVLNEEITAIEQTESIISLLSLRLNYSAADVRKGLYQVKNAKVRGSEHSRILTDEELTLIREILAEFGMKLSSFVSNRLPMLNLSELILDAVRDGRLSPTNAVILNRQPSEIQQILIKKANGLTKQELINMIEEQSQDITVPPAKETDRQPIADRVWERLKAVRKNKALLQSQKVQTCLSEIERLLEEIEAQDE